MTAALLALLLLAAEDLRALPEPDFGLIVEAAEFVLRLTPAAVGPAVDAAAGDGTRVATLEVSGRFADYRGQPVPPGAYALLLARQPPLKDHFGTAPAPEFVLLARADTQPVAGLAAALFLARAVTRGSHPLVLRLVVGGPERPAGLSAADAAGEQVVWMGGRRAGVVVVGRAAEPEL